MGFFDVLGMTGFWGLFDVVSPPGERGTREGKVPGRFLHLLHANLLLLLLLRQTRAMFLRVCALIMVDYRLERGPQVIT